MTNISLKHRKLLFLCLFVTVLSDYTFSQVPRQNSAQNSARGNNSNQASRDQETPIQDSVLSPNAQLALSAPDYRVTPGDVYILSYLAGTNPVQYTIIIDRTYQIRVANLGIVNAAGRTFNQVKAEVETIVLNNFPFGAPQFTLRQPSTFRVYIQGEVQSARTISVWALVRLEDILEDHLTPFSSLRNVSIRSSNGQVRTYDLFRAHRFGDLTQNPYLRPDDVITVNRAERLVTVEGAVERPDIYQLLAGENLRELIEVYASGFTPYADLSRMELVRLVDSDTRSGDKILLSEEDLANNFILHHFDTVIVPDITSMRPVIFVEGAVGNTAASEEESSASPEETSRLVIPFIRGETYGTFIRRNRDLFNAVSDTASAYIIRGNEYIPLNLNPILFDETIQNELVIVENDTLIIPFRQLFVTVSGAVFAPGRYPYIPDRSWEYYIALAGGFVPGRNARDSINIVDISGRRLTKSSIITPETIITANTNHFLFQWNQYAPVITAVLSIITTTLSIWMITSR